MGEKSAGNVIAQYRELQAESAAARAHARWASASWASARRCFWPRRSAAWTPSRRPALEELQQAEEVGPKVAESIFQFFREPRNRELVERLRAAGLQFDYQSTRPKGGPLQGTDVRADRHAAQPEPRGGQAADRERPAAR